MTALLALRGLAAHDRRRVVNVFRAQNPGPETLLRIDDLDIIVTGNGQAAPCVQHESGAFVAASGVPMYKDRFGSDALDAFLSDLVIDQIDEHRLGGSFAAISWNGHGTARLFTDWLGSTCAYRSDAGTVWSTSFLATAASLPIHHLDRQGAWEYIFQGSPYGESTVLEGIRRIDCEKWHDLFSGSAHDRARLVPRREIRKLHFNESVDLCVNALDAVFDAIGSAFHNRIDTALSGGYDSRLILAALRVRGITPRLHVYGRATDPDVRIAQAIAKGEALELEHIDKSAYAPALDRDALVAAIRRNFIMFDATPPDGIFDAGVDLATREQRMAGGYLALNGGGGEIFRNFYYMMDRPYTLNDLMGSFYSRFDPDSCSAIFDERDYLRRLAAKVLDALHISEEEFGRCDVERAYPLFRCRYWMSHNTSINNSIGRALTPLVHTPALCAAVATPISHKTHGRLESAMIGKIDPRLAAYESDSRRTLSGKPTLAEIAKDYSSMVRPVWMRRRTYRYRQRLMRDTPYSEWMNQFGSAIASDWSAVRELVIPERIKDVNHLRRAATLQFLVDSFGSSSWSGLR